MKIKYSEVKQGQTFKRDGLSFTKLNDALSIINTIDRDISFCVFDNYDNNYKKSLIRHYINNRYCELMCIDKTELLPVNEMGDKLTLLSKEEYEEFKNIIPQVDRWCWLRSPSPYGSYRAYLVYYIGDWDDYHVYCSYAVRPALIFNPEVNVEVSHE